MKKKIVACFCLVLMCAATLLSACAFSNARMSGTIDLAYVVKSNGGSAVQMGNYVYFVNGFEDTIDEDGKQNEWGKVVKGGVYRAELIGKKVDYTFYNNLTQRFETAEGVKDFQVGIASDKTDLLDIDLDFTSQKGEDYEENEIDIIDVERLVPKVISSTNSKGLFIYDNYIYYTTAHNLRDKTGIVRNDLTDFMRTRLDGKKTQLLYTSSTSEFEYHYYYQDGRTYLVVFEEGKLISYAMDSNKIRSKLTLSEGVTSVAFCEQNDIWYKSMPTNSMKDYVIFTRSQTDDDIIKEGNTVEIVRPNGDDKTEVIQNRQEVTVDYIRDDLLFYTSGGVVVYTDLANVLYDLTGQAPYVLKEGATLTTKNVATRINPSSWSRIVGHRNNPYSDFVEFWAFSQDEIRLLEDSNNGQIILNRGASLVHFDQARSIIYYTLTDDTADFKTLYMTDARVLASEKGENPLVQVLTQKFKESFFGVDFAAGQMFFLVEEIDEYAPNYMNVRRSINGSEKESFIGQRKEEDIKEEEEE